LWLQAWSLGWASDQAREAGSSPTYMTGLAPPLKKKGTVEADQVRPRPQPNQPNPWAKHTLMHFPLFFNSFFFFNI